MRNRISAIRALRSKKMAEQSLAQKLDHLSQLEGNYNQIEQAVNQVSMIEAMKGTTRILRRLHSEIGEVENVENIVEELQTEMLKSDGISDAIKEAAPGTTSAVDDEAIDAELALLIDHTNLSNDEKQVRDVVARLDSISPPEELSLSMKPQQPNDITAVAKTTLAIPSQGDLLVAASTNPIT